ncbi:tRNA pseudouridine55 synthase [Acetoanaerobium pronyense]|uniref:tRNA pseudouridine synthase B n=1 Tax=Acetoanaerobium pronyense TaxID=1482736 RepID=A0ABS4KF91_9FIRM|nr:tRNA pseudouridine(55) synthase TruB [Acetoanaerobium pronyense]MBP2026447.1 tRNA pseudouridine55 synthase [Acetoanaerobium pronyense]
MDGVINILKPTGMTSHDVVGFIRKNFKIKKVGHTGTLDPNAAGVLPICIGKGTKLSQYIMEKEKSYRCELIFGKTTDTLDSYGKIISEKLIDPIDFYDIEKTVKTFIGQISQIPPAYSAIKVNGVKLYEKARKGIEINDIPIRTVTIHNINIISYEFPRLMMDIRCSSGTYIRSLVRDIGEKLESPSYMSLLIRTKSGEFKIEEALAIEELTEDILNEKLTSLKDIKLNMQDITLKSSASVSYINGSYVSQKGLKSTLCEYQAEENVRVFDELGSFIGIGKIREKDSVKYLKGDTLLI